MLFMSRNVKTMFKQIFCYILVVNVTAKVFLTKYLIYRRLWLLHKIEYIQFVIITYLSRSCNKEKFPIT